VRRRLLRLFGALLVIALAAGLGLAARQWFGIVRISGTSMNDTLQDGDLVLFTRFDYRFGGLPGFGQVVECRSPGRADTYVKRVIGLPGQSVALRGGTLTIDGRAVSEPYVSSEAEDYEIRLGEDAYLLLGDNRAESYDSRMADMGTVDRTALLGRARLILWPPERFGAVE